MSNFYFGLLKSVSRKQSNSGYALCLSLVFSVFINLCFLAPAYSMMGQDEDPVYTARLAPQTLANFSPLVLSELGLETAFQDTVRTQRKTREYGYSFFQMMNGNFTYAQPPEFLNELGKEVCKALGRPEIQFTNFILSLYEPGFHLEPHVDMDKSGFQNHGFCWGEEVFGVIIEPDVTGHLYYVKYEGDDSVPPLNLNHVYELEENAGTVFMMKGKFRHAPYNHGVSEVSRHRISVTFRTTEIKNQ